MEIQDSGNRRQFDSGAVRDIAKGKGRFDLMPLDILAEIGNKGKVVYHINEYMETGKYVHLIHAVQSFADAFMCSFPCAILETAKQFEDGAIKYGEHNWEKGIPIHCYIDSGLRHYYKYLAGEKDEPHDRAFIWNMLCAAWTHKHKPECIDIEFGNNLIKDKDEYEQD